VDELSKTANYGGVSTGYKLPSKGMPIAVSLRAPYSIYRLFPQPLKNLLHKLKVWMLMRDFRKCGEVEQSVEDASASASMAIVVPIRDAPAVTRRCLSSLENMLRARRLFW